MAIVYQKSKGLTDAELHYCPGCTHGIIHKLVAETLEEMDVLGNTIGVAPVGCSVFAYNYFNCDMHEAAHGRAPAVATGIKRVAVSGARKGDHGVINKLTIIVGVAGEALPLTVHK